MSAVAAKFKLLLLLLLQLLLQLLLLRAMRFLAPVVSLHLFLSSYMYIHISYICTYILLFLEKLGKHLSPVIAAAMQQLQTAATITFIN